MRHVTMELGGKSPLIVFDDADLEDAVGARCSATSIPRGRSARTARGSSCSAGCGTPSSTGCASADGAIRMGDPLDEATQMGPLVSAAQMEKVLGYIEGAWPRARGW
jgi:betaine-aldehyde dehydrogenase